MIKTEYGETTIKGSEVEILADVAVIVCAICKRTPIDVKLIIDSVKDGFEEAYGIREESYGGENHDTLRS